MPAYVPAAETPQEAHARTERVECRRDERTEDVRVAVEKHRDERPACRCELVDDVHAVYTNA